MRPLPPLVARRHRWVLPMADASAGALADALLTDEPLDARSTVRGAMAADPPLFLWTVLAADRLDGTALADLDTAAQWLASHALEVLPWPSGKFPPWRDGQEADAAPWGQRVARAMELSAVATAIADAQGGGHTAAAQAMGMLHDAPDWLSAGGGASAEAARPFPLPDWLASACRAQTPAADLVGQAAAMLAGGGLAAAEAGVDLDQCRREGQSAGRRWSEPQPGIADRLPRLAAKLARLAELEHRFDEAVETEKLGAMAEFSAGAGHEINNPLTVIAGRAQLFLHEETDPERRRALALISVQAMRVYEMIADMRLFARPPRPQPQRFDLAELVDRLIDELLPAATRQRIELTRTGEPGPVEIEADPTQITVALRAMYQNALEAIGTGGRIELSIRRAGPKIEIRLADDGPGITPDQRRHVFDPYYSARQAGRGLGLGLSKAWRIARMHGGLIDVESEPGRGAAFTVTLPVEFSPPADA